MDDHPGADLGNNTDNIDTNIKLDFLEKDL